MTDKHANITKLAVGGGLLAGLGIGFFFLETSALAFVGCIFIGLGFGLLAVALLSRIGRGCTP